MKKLLLIGALLCVLCSCGSGNGGAKKSDEDVVKEDRAEYKDYVILALEQEMYGNKSGAVNYYKAALELEQMYSGTEYSHWFDSNVEDKLEEFINPPTTGTYKGHDWVDLGLSVKWATCNVGASTPGAYGNYYAWGETSTKFRYDEDNCSSRGKSWGDIGGNSSRDAATANWGSGWRMPTETECQELIDDCTWTWTTQNGHHGYKVTSTKNGQSIFLPAAGSRYGYDNLIYEGEIGVYWTSTPQNHTYYAEEMYFCDYFQEVDGSDRDDGSSVRPVLED